MGGFLREVRGKDHEFDIVESEVFLKQLVENERGG